MFRMIRPILLLLCLASCAMAQTTATAPAGKFPPLNVQVTVGTQEKAEAGSFYRKTMTIIPKVTIEGSSRMTPHPPAEAVMLIITMDSKAKFKDHKDVYKVFTAETLPIPQVQTGDRRQFTFQESSTTFDGYRDATNVGGEIYKYLHLSACAILRPKPSSTSRPTVLRSPPSARRIPPSARNF